MNTKNRQERIEEQLIAKYTEEIRKLSAELYSNMLSQAIKRGLLNRKIKREPKIS